MESETPSDIQRQRTLSQWFEIQEDLSRVTGLTFLVMDPQTGYLPQRPEESPLCRFLQDRPGGYELCQQDCGRAVLLAAQKGEVVSYKCYGQLNNVAIPVRFPYGGEDKQWVILGGRTFFSYQDFSSYREKVQEMGGDIYKLLEMTKSLIFKERSFLEASARFVGRFANTMLDQKGNIDQLRDRVSRLLTLCRVSRDVCMEIHSPDIYQTIVSTVGILFDSKMAFLLIRRKGTELFKVVETFGLQEGELREATFQESADLIQRVVRGNRPVFSTDGYEILKSGLPKDSRSVHLFPIGGINRVDGLLVLLNTALTEEEELEVTFFCSQISLAVENRHLSEEKSERRENLSYLTEVLRTIASSMDSEEVYSAILEKAAELTGAAQGSLMILNEASLEMEVKAAKGVNRSIFQHLRVKSGEGIAGTVLKTGTPFVVGNVEEDRRVMKVSRPRYRSKAFVSFPLKVNDKIIGVLNLTDKREGDVFSEEEIGALATLTLYASVAVERFRYFQTSMDLRKISITDLLSGLLNRRYFEERLAEEIERSKRYGEPFSLIMLDIDNFKSFNDSYGHLVGDEALRNTASGIRRCVRTIDIAARYGGEEFAVILPQAEKEDARAIGERIRQEIEQEGIKIPGEDQRAGLTVSIGIASYPADAVSQDQEELIRHADRALYQAKALGKNRVVLFREM